MRDHVVRLSDATPLPSFADEWQKKTPYTFADGITVVIEYMSGDKRTKHNDSGFVTAGVMPTAYGYILGTTDAHGEELDMYLAPSPDQNGNIYVIDQVNPSTGVFDEHKVMLGFSSADEAVFMYLSVFADNSGEARAGKVTTMSVDSFNAWLKEEGSFLKPASDSVMADLVVTMLAGISRTARTNREAPEVRDEAGGVIVELPSIKQGPKIKTLVDEDKFHHHLYLFSALEEVVWSNAIDTFIRILDFANEGETAHIHIACPGGSVFLMGRMVSAIRRTKATVITYAIGSVASAATTIWSVGHQRRILPAAYFMQHMSSQLLSDKTTNISAKANFCVNYIEGQLETLTNIGLFTEQEVRDMSEKSADIYISGSTATQRVGSISGNVSLGEGVDA